MDGVEGNNVTDTIWPEKVTFMDDGAAEPKYIVLVQSLRAAIRSGELTAGARLPPVRELAWQLGVTPGTVARAYRMATDEGLLAAQVGRGTFVAGSGDPQPVVEPSLISPAEPDSLDFRACRVADLGQGAVIAGALARIAAAGSYIDYPTDATDRPARLAVRDWIGQDRAGRLSEDDVVLSFGAQNAVMTVLQACLTGPAPVILTENLAYPGARHAARLLRATLIGVEMDDEGIRPDRLEEALRRHGGQVLLTSAEVHSPTTIRTSAARRQEIAALARRYHFQIVEDDCHCISRPETPAYRALCPERGWYVSSLSKCFSPSLRFGFAACPSSLARAARQVAQSSYYGLPQPMLDLAAELLASGAVEETRRAALASVEARVRAAVNALGGWNIAWREEVPFLWLRLSQGWRCSTFSTACEAAGIRIKPADEFALADGAAPHAVRLALNPGIPEDRFAAGLATLSGLLRRPPIGVEF